MKFLKEKDIETLLNKQVSGKNTTFLKNSHSLWLRFKNYDKHPPFALRIKDVPVAVIYATSSTKTKYINLYEIVTLQGNERKGYGHAVWNEFVDYWHKEGMQRIKLSCTPDSIGFHVKNGLVFWSVDKSGSLRSDQPMMKSSEDQINLRNKALNEPNLVIPSSKVCDKLKNEDIENLKISKNKLLKTYEAIQTVGDYWMRKHLYG